MPSQLSLVEMVEGMKPNTRKWAEFWVQDGAPDAPYAEEHHVMTGVLRPFRKAYYAATDEARRELADHVGAEFALTSGDATADSAVASE
jgi:hypothetical protein